MTHRLLLHEGPTTYPEHETLRCCRVEVDPSQDFTAETAHVVDGLVPRHPAQVLQTLAAPAVTAHDLVRQRRQKHVVRFADRAGRA